MTGTRRTSGSNGKYLALFLAAATAITLTAAILPGGPFLEWWQIHRLSRRLAHGTLAEKVEATEELGRTGSSRAVIPLLRFIADQASHLDVQRIEASRTQGAGGVPVVTHDVQDLPTKEFCPRKGRHIGPILEEADLLALVQSASVQPPHFPTVPDLYYSQVFRTAPFIWVTAGEDLQQRVALAVKALLHWYDPATEYAEARQALARIGKHSIPVLKKAVREADHPGVRALAALELVRLGVEEENQGR